MTLDQDREEQIIGHGKEIELQVERAGETSEDYFLCMGAAHAARIAMTDLIKQRPPEYVRALELTRGLF